MRFVVAQLIMRWNVTKKCTTGGVMVNNMGTEMKNCDHTNVR